jgi:hypothetical protein
LSAGCFIGRANQRLCIAYDRHNEEHYGPSNRGLRSDRRYRDRCFGGAGWKHRLAMLVPRFDSDACFAALLGTPEHGRWLISAADHVDASRRYYRGETLILETVFETKDGWRE